MVSDDRDRSRSMPSSRKWLPCDLLPAGDGLARNRICRPRFLGFDAGREAPSRSAPTIDFALPCHVRRYPAGYRYRLPAPPGAGWIRRSETPRARLLPSATPLRNSDPGGSSTSFLARPVETMERPPLTQENGALTDRNPRAYGRGVSPRRPKHEALSLSRPALPRAAAGRADRSPGNPARCPRRRAASAVRRRGRDRGRATI